MGQWQTPLWCAFGAAGQVVLREQEQCTALAELGLGGRTSGQRLGGHGALSGGVVLVGALC